MDPHNEHLDLSFLSSANVYIMGMGYKIMESIEHCPPSFLPPSGLTDLEQRKWDEPCDVGRFTQAHVELVQQLRKLHAEDVPNLYVILLSTRDKK